MKSQEIDTLVSELMATAGSPWEARAIASLADAGMFQSAGFVRNCVPLPRTRVVWRRVTAFRHSLPEDDPRIGPLERATRDARFDAPSPPSSLEELQVAVELDQPEGPHLAAWRDEYAADPRTPNPYHHHVDLVLDELRRRGECWDCGQPAVATVNELLVCARCKENS